MAGTDDQSVIDFTSALGVGPPSPFALASAESALEIASEKPDPLSRLLDPGFTEVLWEYEHSRVEPELPGVLHAKQVAALSDSHRHRWMIAGNQSGKTTVGAVDVVLMALGRHPFLQYWKPPIRAWASALTWELWENTLLPEILTWIPPDRIIDAPEPYVQSTKRHIRIRADNGKESWITGKAAQQGAEKYQSARVHVVWLDEEHPERVWDEMQPRLLRHGGITIATMTPLKGFTWVYRRIYEPWKRGQARDHGVIQAGLSDNPAIGKAEIDALKRSLAHDPAQLAARLEGAFTAPAGLALRFDPERHFVDMNQDAAEALVSKGAPFAGLDFGAWRFAFLLLVADRIGRLHVVEEYFSQRETLEERARAIDKLVQRYGINPKKLPIWGDLANLTDIIEINAAFRRIGSKVQVMPVAAENKIRTASVERINALLERDALLVRRDLAGRQLWHMGRSAATEGQPVVGSRLAWEVGAWCYPEPKEGHEQEQDPSDASADGADCIAALRYAVMSWWTAAGFKIERSRMFKQEQHQLAAQAMQGRIPKEKPRRRGRTGRPAGITHPEFGRMWKK